MLVLHRQLLLGLLMMDLLRLRLSLLLLLLRLRLVVLVLLLMRMRVLVTNHPHTAHGRADEKHQVPPCLLPPRPDNPPPPSDAWRASASAVCENTSPTEERSHTRIARACGCSARDSAPCTRAHGTSRMPVRNGTYSQRGPPRNTPAATAPKCR